MLARYSRLLLYAYVVPRQAYEVIDDVFLGTDEIAHLLAELLAGLSFAREDGVLRNLALPTAMGLGCKTLRRGEADLTGETERSFVLASRCARV